MLHIQVECQSAVYRKISRLTLVTSSPRKLELPSCLDVPISLVKYHCLQILLRLVNLAPIKLQLRIKGRKWMLCFISSEHLRKPIFQNTEFRFLIFSGEADLIYWQLGWHDTIARFRIAQYKGHQRKNPIKE